MVSAKDILCRRYARIDVADTVSRLLGALRRYGDSFAIVFDGIKYRGIVSKRWLLSSRFDPSKMKVGNIIKHRSKSKITFFSKQLGPGTPLKEVCRLFASAEADALPVIERARVLGIVRLHDALEAVQSRYRGVPVASIISKNLLTIKEDAEIGKAMKLMSRSGFDRLPVVDSRGRLSGVIGIIDFLGELQLGPRRRMHVSRAASHQNGRHVGYDVGEKLDVLRCPLRSIMSRVSHSCACKSSVFIAIRHMLHARVHSIIIVKNNKPIGILTARDIMRDFVRRRL